MKKLIYLTLLLSLVSCSHLKWLEKNCDIALKICSPVDSVPNNTSTHTRIEEDSTYNIGFDSAGVSFEVNCDSMYNPIITSLMQYNEGLNDELTIKDNRIDYLVNYPQKVIEKKIYINNTDSIYIKEYVPNPINQQLKDKNTELKTKLKATIKIAIGLFLLLLVIGIIIYFKIRKKFN